MDKREFTSILKTRLQAIISDDFNKEVGDIMKSKYPKDSAKLRGK